MPTKTKTETDRRDSRDLLDDIASATEDRLETAYEALFREAGGEDVPAGAIHALGVIGDEDDVKKARIAARRAHSAVRELKATEGAAERAEKARAKLERDAPAIREQIEQLNRQLAELERAPLRHEQDAKRHEKARKMIGDNAPAYIKKRYTAESHAKLTPLRKRLNELKAEHRRLGVLLDTDPNDPDRRHIVMAVKDEHGERPWIARDVMGRGVVDQQAWLQHLHTSGAAERRDELTEQIEQTEAELAKAEAEVGKQLDYWLHVAKRVQGE